jgi:queuine/archaeosine tRNA-ribosyltransferase
MFELTATDKSIKAWRGRLQAAHRVIDTPAFISPEIAMEIQGTLGSEIATVLDQCTDHPCK